MILHRPRATRASSFAAVQMLAVMAIAAAASSAAAADGPIDLALYGRMLDSHTRIVDDLVGVEVDYPAIAKEPDWKQLVHQIEAARPSRLDRKERIAFWINAYNILTIDLVVEHYPLGGIREIGSFFSPVWDIEVTQIEGKAVSLGQIEHEILRPMGEPRVHASIVCASVSCPPLARTPFRPETLDQDLSAAMRAWLANPGKGIRIDRDARRVTISKIFDWFEEDFEANGGPLSMIAHYLDDEDAQWIRTRGKTASIDHFKYDWSLNDFKR